MVDSSEAARLLGKMPKGRRFERVCPVCGKTFMATARGVVCSRACGWTYQNRRRAKQSTGGTESKPDSEG